MVADPGLQYTVGRRNSKMADAANKYVYFFGKGKADGKSEMRALLGGKGANLAEMTNIGLPVPAGFTITTFKHILRI